MLQLHLLGGFELSAPGHGPIRLSGRSCRTLLAYLALHRRRPPRREAAAGLLWPDRTDRSAQKKLRNALWRVRCAVPEGMESVTVDGERLGLHPTVWIDVDEFRSGLGDGIAVRERPLTAEDVARIECALGLYQGDLLDGADEHWVAGPRQTLRQLHQNALEQLFLHHRASGEFRPAIVRGRQLLRENPFLERIHRELMLCHWALGDRPMAVRQYRACERILRRDLDLEPMPETRSLLARIRDDPGPGESTSRSLEADVRAPPPAQPGSPGGDAPRSSATEATRSAKSG